MKPWKKFRKREMYARIANLQRECDAAADRLSTQGQSLATRDKRVKNLEAELRDARRTIDTTDRFARDHHEEITRLRKDLDTANHEIKLLRAAPASGLLAAANDREKANVEVIEGLRRKLKEERARREATEHELTRRVANATENERLFRANEAAQEIVIERERQKGRECGELRGTVNALRGRVARALAIIQAPEAICDTATGVDLAAYRSDLLARVAVALR